MGTGLIGMGREKGPRMQVMAVIRAVTVMSAVIFFFGFAIDSMCFLLAYSPFGFPRRFLLAGKLRIVNPNYLYG